jgi:hypothetical protein
MAIADAMGHKDLRQMTTYAKVDEAHRQAGVDVMDDLVKHHRPPKTPRIWPAPTDAAAPRRASADLSADQRPSKPVMETPLEDLTGLQPWSDVAGAL